MNREISFVSVFLGIIGAVLISASSFYIVLKYGALPWPTIMATLISMFFLSIIGRKNKKEINITHTIMTSGSMVAGGAAFTIPAFILLGGKLEEIDPLILFITLLTGSLLGAILSFSIRRKLIEEDKLDFPIGLAAYELINNGNNKKQMLFVALGTLFSSVISVLRDIPLGKGKTPLIPTVLSFKGNMFSLYVSPLLVGIGYILGFLNTFTWFLGAVLTYIIAKPLALKKGFTEFDTMKNSFAMGFIIGIGLAIVVKIIFTRRKKTAGGGFNPWIFLILMFFIGVITYVYKLPLFLSVILVLITALSAVVAGYTTGKTGVNPMEIYAIITILSISFLASVFNNLNINNSIFNYIFHSNISMLYLFLISGIVAVACGLAGDIMNDFKAGYELKTNPRLQLFGEALGATVSSVVITFLFFVFFRIYKNIGPTADNPELLLTQASIIASIVKGIPFMSIFLGGMLAGFILNLLKLPVLTFGIGIYLPFFITVPVFIGGLLSFFISNLSKRPTDNFLFFANGLMSGEAIVGIIISIIAYIKFF